MSSTRRRRLRAEHERQLLARESSRRRDAVAHSAPVRREVEGLAKVLAAIALLVVLLMIAVALAA
jgi:hypothetical protein